MPSRLTVAALLSSALLAAASAAAGTRDRVPAIFLHDHVWVTPTLEGRPLRFFTDTGGGWNAVSAAVADRHGWPRESTEHGDLVPWPSFDAKAGIPAPPPYFMGGRLAVADAEMLFGGDGFLGGRWFADGIWEFDYPNAALYRRARGEPDGAHPHRVALGFQTDADGRRTTHFPSIDVTVDGEVLPMLYDSGATATTTAVSAPVFSVTPGTPIGVSFIEHAVFERWREAHPDWRVLEAADRKGPQERRMIEVPAITVAGHTVGPVWFAEQPAGAFQTYMAGMMDRPTWGALGGSGLKYFRVVLDYPGATATFHRDAD